MGPTRVHSPSLLPFFLLALVTCTTNVRAATAEHFFSFGDSLASIGFDPQRGATTLTPLTTSSGGNNWIQYLHDDATPADSFYNFASLGATISSGVVDGKGAADFASQVAAFTSEFGTSAEVRWTADTSLFTIWFGSDDILSCLVNGYDFINLQPFLLTALDSSISNLYAAGARNFLLIDILSLERSPLAQSSGAALVQAAIIYWNERLEVYAQYFDQIFPGATVVYYEASEFSKTVLDAPETYGIQNFLSACEAYAYLNHEPTGNVPACGAPLKEFFWKDNWHPSFRIHQLLAQDIASRLSANLNLSVLPLTSPTSPLGTSAGSISVIFPSSPTPLIGSPIVVSSSSPVVVGSSVTTSLAASSTSVEGRPTPSVRVNLVTSAGGRAVRGWGGAALAMVVASFVL